MLGQDLRSRVLPGLGPRVLAFVDTPVDWDTEHRPEIPADRTWPFPVVLALELQADPDRNSSAPSAAKQPTVADALENGLNTVLALATLNGKLAEVHTRFVTHNVAGVTVNTLDPSVPFACAVDHAGNQLVLSSFPGAVDRFLAHDSGSTGGSRFKQLRSRAFPTAHSFLCLDLAATETMLATHRERILAVLARQNHRPRDEVARDLDQFIALTRLFDAAYLTSRMESDSATAFQTFGLLTRPGELDGATSQKP